jgi:hypothetical protein
MLYDIVIFVARCSLVVGRWSLVVGRWSLAKKMMCYQHSCQVFSSLFCHIKQKRSNRQRPETSDEKPAARCEMRASRIEYPGSDSDIDFF